MDIVQEEWRAAVGVPGYEASNTGKIRRVHGVKFGKKASTTVGLVPYMNHRNTMYVVPYINGRQRCRALAHIVFLTFIGDIGGARDIDYLDGDRSNCAAHNLIFRYRRYRRLKPGLSFFRWTLLEYKGKDRFGDPTWLCRCACGTEKVVSGGHLTQGKTKSCGCYRSIFSSQQRGELHPNWDGGVTNAGSPAWARWRLKSLRAHAAVSGTAPIDATADDIIALWSRTSGRCSVCQVEHNDGRQMAIDHDHSTGKLRGLLCNRCNSAIAMAKDSADRLLAMAEYVRSSGVIA